MGLYYGQHRDEEPSLSTRQPAFQFVDLFAGIGGMRLPFEKLGGECVFTSEWDKFAVKTYEANFVSGHEISGDIRVIPEEEVPPHDVLVAGFPCQPFSIAGVSKKNALGRPHGFLCETQGTLFFDVARILSHHRPKAFVLENVKHLLRHDKGRTFDVIRRTLADDLGYHVDWMVIDAQGFVPQHRERTVIVGLREPSDFRMADVKIPPADSGPKLATILHPEDGTEPAEPPYTDGPSAEVASKYTLTEHLWGYLQSYAAKHQAMGNGFGFGLFGPDDVARTLSARYYKDGSEILIVRAAGPPPRRLTPRECARLMGFDGYGGRPFRIPVSDTQAYRQFGNALVPYMIDAVARVVVPIVTGSALPDDIVTAASR